ncbi:MAG: aldehyde dehydrogenase family protein [Ignavibacteriales bacterium]|nr:aldehyde dehydrogenase family protein [Ignavibacteriales bacterium]
MPQHSDSRDKNVLHCSRAIVDASVYDKFVEKLKAAVDQIQVWPAEENYRMGPVVSSGAERSILSYIEVGKNEGRLLNGGSKAVGNGFYIKPTVIVDVDPYARISQEEIFGPVLAVIKSPNFEESLKIANNTKYGLTGALYSKNRKKIERAKKELLIGNLYFNRKCTGALVGGHPFGGFNMSVQTQKPAEEIICFFSCKLKLMSEKVK